MYKTRYTFWNEGQFPLFRESLSRIYDNSRENYLKSHNPIVEKDLKIIDTFMIGLENYYSSIICNGIVTNKNYKNILNQLEAIDLIVIPKKRDIYGATLGYQISLNPDIDDSLKQICVSHELGHIINNKWKSEAKELSKELYDDPRNKDLFDQLNIDDYRYLVFGFDLIDEVVAQEVAERVNCRLKKQKRPAKEERYNENLFNHNPYLSNYTLYGELYGFAYDFSRKLDYVNLSKNCSEEEYMLRFVRRSFDEDFIKNIGMEIKNSDYNKKRELLTMLCCMGKIKASAYEVVGLNNKKENKDVKDYVDIFNSVKGR